MARFGAEKYNFMFLPGLAWGKDIGGLYDDLLLAIGLTKTVLV